MKPIGRHSLFLLAAFLCLFMVACTSDDDNTTPASTLPVKPEAVAGLDHSSAGIVKGVLVGSTGTFKFSIKNGNDSIYCRMTFDGKTGLLLPETNLSSWKPGTAFESSFSGTVGTQQVFASFSCNSDGGSPIAFFEIAGHDVAVSLAKETSSMLIKGYEGSYTVRKSTSDKTFIRKGIFNFILYNNQVTGQRSDNDVNYSFTGTVSNGKLTINNDVLYITDTKVSGLIPKPGDGEEILVSGERTL